MTGLVVLAAGFLWYALMKGENPDTQKKEGKSDPLAEVELDLFSGRPNPVWTLNHSFTEELLNRISRLASARTIPIDGVGQLGYQGFRITLPASSEYGDTAIVFSGKITLIRNRRRMYYDDPERQLEIWLLSTSATANPPLDQGLLEELVAGIGSGK